MQLDVRKYLKQVKETDDLKVLEQEFKDAIEAGRQFSDKKYDKSPILNWLANRKLETGGRGSR